MLIWFALFMKVVSTLPRSSVNTAILLYMVVLQHRIIMTKQQPRVSSRQLARWCLGNWKKHPPSLETRTPQHRHRQSWWNMSIFYFPQHHTQKVFFNANHISPKAQVNSNKIEDIIFWPSVLAALSCGEVCLVHDIASKATNKRLLTHWLLKNLYH